MYDIIFLSYGEPNADENWESLKSRFPRAMRVDGVSPIVAAHKEAARKCRTSYFWVVDADNVVSPEFDFSFQWPRDDSVKDRVAVWRANNPAIGLTYGYGGIKLLPRRAVLSVPDDVIDFTTSISEHFHPMEEVASTTHIDSSPFDAWRAAFRETVKLTARVIARQNDEESDKRLAAWLYCEEGKQGWYAFEGAKHGWEYAMREDDLSKINDWEWLRNEFHRTTRHSV